MKFFKSIHLVISLVSIPITAIEKQAHIEGKFFSKLSDYGFFKDLTNQIPIQTPNQIIIQGNKRLENELILRSSGIEKIGTDDKSLSLAIKNLYKTGYFEDVKIYKDKNMIFINVKENPIVDQISIEGNKEITDDIILA